MSDVDGDIVDRIVATHALTPSARLLWLFIYRRGVTVQIPVAEMAAGCGLSLRTAYRSLAELRMLGVLDTQPAATFVRLRSVHIPTERRSDR